jgi:hypothetical protein
MIDQIIFLKRFRNLVFCHFLQTFSMGLHSSPSKYHKQKFLSMKLKRFFLRWLKRKILEINKIPGKNTFHLFFFCLDIYHLLFIRPFYQTHWPRLLLSIC